jgi:hypothetical protein
MPNRPLNAVEASEWAAAVIKDLATMHPQVRALDSWDKLSAADHAALAASGSFTIVGRRVDPSEYW